MWPPKLNIVGLRLGTSQKTREREHEDASQREGQSERGRKEAREGENERDRGRGGDRENGSDRVSGRGAGGGREGRA